MGHEFISDVLQPLAIFGGIGGMIWISVLASVKARMSMRPGQPLETHAPASEDKILAEMKAMRQQMEQMQSTGHQFDLSSDEALNRLEGRINRLETKSAAGSTPSSTDKPNTLRNGQGQ